ncbi:hypothetical protein SADUNF_Sadunf01G0006800 [Salix dunnii]|uniref:Uncharacterized protein n=1 Tax=Salix dunnii TaxID=1413687 RepID=A0A835N957_9ROSI|nr:hypothetical protein SADUNF_Sadunf01G0006800 [Salix dunnii]
MGYAKDAVHDPNSQLAVKIDETHHEITNLRWGIPFEEGQLVLFRKNQMNYQVMSYIVKEQIPIHGSNEVSMGRKGSSGRRKMTEDEGRDINDLADAFIKNFHSHLKIQMMTREA